MGGTVSAMATPSRQDRAEAIARDIRQLFEAVGLPEWKTRSESTAGGYYISTYECRVKLNWSTEAPHSTPPPANYGSSTVTTRDPARMRGDQRHETSDGRCAVCSWVHGDARAN